MQQRLENFIAKAAIALDHIILPLKIEWKHNYRRERIQLYPSVKFCKELQELGADIQHETAYEDYFDWVLFDGKEIVLKYGCRGFENNKIFIISPFNYFNFQKDYIYMILIYLI